MTLSDISIKNPVFAWMLMIGLIVFGWIRDLPSKPKIRPRRQLSAKPASSERSL